VRGKVALVTGGSRGIGEMIARGCVENGAKAYITARNADACDALAREPSRIGECISIPADLSRMDEVERLAAEMQRREKRLDVLVNEEVSQIVMRHTPMLRIGRPEDMAGVALYLSSKARGFVCEATIAVDGGYATTA
jgi:NAD(P)-dependent dehydrogenase (short-subunit alcohol dehydrogenase family)